MPEKTIAVVMAFNEKDYIKHVLEPLIKARREGVVDHILVVDDGSTDGTGNVVRKFARANKAKINVIVDDGDYQDVEKQQPKDAEITIIRHRKNKGKPQGFVTAARYCIGMNATIMFTTDADMVNLEVSDIKEFLSHIKDGGKERMTRTAYYQYSDEGLSTCIPEISGFRAVRRSILEEMLRDLKKPDSKWSQYFKVSGKIAIENVLERVIPPNEIAEVTGLRLLSRPMGDGATPPIRINTDMERITAVEEKRKETARGLLALRELRLKDPNNPQVKGKDTKKLRKTAERLTPEGIEDIVKLIATETAPAHKKRPKQAI